MLGVIFYQTRQLQRSVDLIDRAIKINPNNAGFYSNRGLALQDLKQLDAAIASYDKAIQLKPESAIAYYNRGNALKELKQLDAAIASYDQAIQLKPDYAEAHCNRGVALKDLEQFDASVASYDKAIQLSPDYAEAYSNRGNALKDLKQLDAAVASYDKAIQLRPDYAEAYSNRGYALRELRQLEAAVASYDKAIQLKPDIEYLFGIMLHTRMQLSDWSNFENNVSELIKKIEQGVRSSHSFPTLSLTSSLPTHRKSAEMMMNDKNPYNPSLGPIPKIPRSNKIRIGYFSADFREHPVSNLLAELFEMHDRSKFELIAFSFGPVSNDSMKERVAAAFDEFIDVRSYSDREIAILSRNLKINIAIDLGGHTENNRIGIFSYRASPIQVSYIGYLGTLGTDYIDYLVADKTIIPKQSQEHYSEKIVYLPNSFQVNDRRKVISDKKFTREELGLPLEGFVFCCFNNNYKITPSIFDSWVRILNSVNGSVLWLINDYPTSAANLYKEAEVRGLDPNRLVFSQRRQLPEYLASYQSADLFLDTLPYNAGTTASDALWAGLPVVTCLGESFASRMAASLLTAINLPELITNTRSEYEDLAIELATDPIKYNSIKSKLAENRLTTPLFDTPLFTRHLEDAYREMYDRYQNDLPPNHIEIESRIGSI